MLIAKQGGVDAVLSTLDVFTASSSSSRHKVLQKACWAVLALASCGAFFGAEGGLCGRCDSRVVVLRCVAPADVVCALLASRGGLERVCAAMKACEPKADVQMYGAWAIANIAWSDPRIKQRAFAAGAVDVCEAAIDRFSRKEPSVCEKAELAIQTIMAEA